MKYQDCRTYGDLLKVKTCSINFNGKCCVCHSDNVEVRKLSTRSNICLPCIQKKGDAVLGRVVRAERKARKWIKKFPNVRKDPKFLHALTKASTEFIAAEIARIEKTEGLASEQ